jgi:hypothetical protein
MLGVRQELGEDKARQKNTFKIVGLKNQIYQYKLRANVARMVIVQ